MAESKHEASRNKLTKAQPKFNRTNINIDLIVQDVRLIGYSIVLPRLRPYRSAAYNMNRHS